MNLANWLCSRTAVFLQVLHSPEAGFARDLRGHSYLVPLLILGLGFALIAAAQAPINLQWTRHHLEAGGMAPEQVSAAVDLLARTSAWRTAGVPLLLLLRWALFALILWLTAQVVLDRLTFSQALTVVAFSYAPLLFRDAVGHLVLLLRGNEKLIREDGLSVSLGLNLMFPGIPLPWSSLAANLNLFEIWYVLLLIAGVAKMAPTRWRKATGVVVPCWLFVAIVQFGLVALG
ncbi:MAG TPA: YIP1 family protein, partial [Acidobacteriota bacterium]|nr:YIP1 family protein [Acidobacteriota bacterium]